LTIVWLDLTFILNALFLQAVELLEFVYDILIDINQNDIGTKEVVAAKIHEILELLVNNVDLKARDAVKFFEVLRGFKFFAPTIITAVRFP